MQGIPWLLASGTAQRSNGSSRDGLLEQALSKVPQGHALYILGSEAPKRSSLHERPASARLGCYGAERSGSAPSIAASAPNLRLAFQPKQYLRTYQDANDYQTPRLRSASLQRIPSARTGPSTPMASPRARFAGAQLATLSPLTAMVAGGKGVGPVPSRPTGRDEEAAMQQQQQLQLVPAQRLSSDASPNNVVQPGAESATQHFADQQLLAAQLLLQQQQASAGCNGSQRDLRPCHVQPGADNATSFSRFSSSSGEHALADSSAALPPGVTLLPGEGSFDSELERVTAGFGRRSRASTNEGAATAGGLSGSLPMHGHVPPGPPSVSGNGAYSMRHRASSHLLGYAQISGSTSSPSHGPMAMRISPSQSKLQGGSAFTAAIQAGAGAGGLPYAKVPRQAALGAVVGNNTVHAVHGHRAAGQGTPAGAASTLMPQRISRQANTAGGMHSTSSSITGYVPEAGSSSSNGCHTGLAAAGGGLLSSNHIADSSSAESASLGGSSAARPLQQQQVSQRSSSRLGKLGVLSGDGARQGCAYPSSPSMQDGANVHAHVTAQPPQHRPPSPMHSPRKDGHGLRRQHLQHSSFAAASQQGALQAGQMDVGQAGSSPRPSTAPGIAGSSSSTSTITHAFSLPNQRAGIGSPTSHAAGSSMHAAVPPAWGSAAVSGPWLHGGAAVATACGVEGSGSNTPCRVSFSGAPSNGAERAAPSSISNTNTSSKERGTAAFPSRLNPAPWNAGQGVSGGGAGGRPAGLQLDGSAALQAVGGLQAGLRPGLLWVGAQAWPCSDLKRMLAGLEDGEVSAWDAGPPLTQQEDCPEYHAMLRTGMGEVVVSMQTSISMSQYYGMGGGTAALAASIAGAAIAAGRPGGSGACSPSYARINTVSRKKYYPPSRSSSMVASRRQSRRRRDSSSSSSSSSSSEEEESDSSSEETEESGEEQQAGGRPGGRRLRARDVSG